MESLCVVVRLPPPLPVAAQTRSGEGTGEGGAIRVDTETAETAKKKRKSTFDARREEIVCLRGELVSLQDTLVESKAARRRSELPLAEVVAANEAMRSVVVQTDVAVASAQSLLSSYGAEQVRPPFGVYIHLPVDAQERQQIIHGVKRQRMLEARAFMLARCKFADLGRQQRQVENYDAPNGDQVAIHWEVVKITERAATVRRVLDEMLYFKGTQEMTMAEMLDVLAIRESEIAVDDAEATQIRLVSSHGRRNRLQVEKNVVMCTQYFERSELLDEPHGLMVVDFVDQDDAYPYQPQERIRKDVTSVTMVVQSPRGTGVHAEAPAVSLIKWSFTRIHHSALAKPADVQGICRDAVRTCFDVMLTSIRERLEWQSEQAQHD